MKTNFINYTHRRGGGVIQENWKQPFSPAVKLGDFVGGERARGLLRHFVWKVLIANLRGAETIFYSSTHRPTIRVYVRARVQFNSRVLLVDSNVSRLASHTHTHTRITRRVHTSCAFASTKRRGPVKINNKSAVENGSMRWAF